MRSIRLFADIGDKSRVSLKRYAALQNILIILKKLNVIDSATVIDVNDPSWTHKVKLP